MLIYHTQQNPGSNIFFNDFRNKRKNKKNGYKSTYNRNHGVIQAKVSGVDGQKKKKSKVRKKLSKKNKHFLEKLGLKVKEKH